MARIPFAVRRSLSLPAARFGQPCSAAELVDLVGRLQPTVAEMDRQAAAAGDPEEIGPTYFEITTAMALMHFADHKVDLAVLEVGLGGRLDSTNVCEPRVSVITSIGFDHTRQLGDTLDSIAWEKAGIFYGGLVELIVNAMVDAKPSYIDWEWH